MTTQPVTAPLTIHTRPELIGLPPRTGGYGLFVATQPEGHTTLALDATFAAMLLEDRRNGPGGSFPGSQILAVRWGAPESWTVPCDPGEWHHPSHVPPTPAADPNYDIHSIDFLEHPELACLPPEFLGMGVLRVTRQGTDQRCTVLVDHDYAVTALAARRDLDGLISLASTASRWLRLGWPEDWGPALNPTWAPLYLKAGQA